MAKETISEDRNAWSLEWKISNREFPLQESSMKLYSLFLIMATATVFSPGPGVLMTLSNALRYSTRDVFSGILGIAVGALVVAAISATSIGIILASSAVAFSILKFIGASYLIYLGLRLWRSPPFKFTQELPQKASFIKRFLEGFSLQLTNPKAIFFFLSVFPQFIDPHEDYPTQFAILVLTYGSLVIGIHSLYAIFSKRAKSWLVSSQDGRTVNKVAASTFMLFGVVLFTAK